MSPQLRLKAEDRKKAIVLAAMPLFAEKGFAATTTRDIAQAAGISEALLYKHFPSKESIQGSMQGILCTAGDSQVEALAAAQPSTALLVKAIFTLFNMICLDDFNPENKNVARLLVRNLAADGEFAADFISKKIAIWRPVLDRLHDAAVKTKDLRHTPVTKRHRFWFAQHLAMALNLYRLPQHPVIPYEVDGPELVDEACAFALRGMGLSDEAIKKYYKPETLRKELLAELSSGSPVQS
jgi:AcrR family transcriptional regulator